MMIKQLDFYGYPYVGIYGSNTENYVVLPPDLPKQVAEEAAEALGVDMIMTLINDSTLVGSMMTGNSNGFIVSDLAMDRSFFFSKPQLLYTQPLIQYPTIQVKREGEIATVLAIIHEKV